MTKIAVIGTGYVGLTTGVCMAKLGHEVVCADVIPEKVEHLKRGEVTIFEDGLEALLKDGLASGKLSFVLGAANAVQDAAVIFMCLPTPQGADGAADLSFLLAAAQEIAAVLPAEAVVVNKSTVPVGSAQLVAKTIGRDDIYIASNPEFLREGTAVYDFFHPDRIVIGAANKAVAQRVADLYAAVDAPKILEDTATAELIKYASNSFLAAKISFANSISNLCEAVGANAHAVLRGMGYDVRIGEKFLQPGPGWGGSCFPKDVLALISIAGAAGYDFDLLKAVVETNEVQLRLTMERIKDVLGGDVSGKTIAAWGLAFKAGTDDIRQSPAIAILQRLIEQGAHVRAYDPQVTQLISGIEHAPSALAAVDGADALVVLTEWPEFSTVDLKDVAERLRTKVLVDARNVIAIEQLEQLGFAYSSLGNSPAHG